MTVENASRREAKEFGRRLRELRISRGYAKARHLATALELNENTYYRYERGLNVPSLQMLKLMCETMDVSICDLLPYKGKSHATGPAVMTAASANAGAFDEAQQQTYVSPVDILATNQTKPELSTPTDQLFLSCSMAAWSVAEIAAELRSPVAGGHAENVRNLAICATVYLSLKRDPFGTISKLLEEWKAVGVSTEVWERAGRAVEQFTATYRAHHETIRELKIA